MSLLFINENNVTIGIESNRCTIKYAGGMIKMVPIETLESITIMGRAQMTTQCVQECLKRGIPVAYFSKGGTYFGRLQSTGHVNAERQRMQCRLYESKFSIDLARNITSAKLKNQQVVLRRYEKSKGIAVSDSIKMLHICREKLPKCQTIQELMGYEGQGAKAYFDGLSALINPEFAFHGRSRRPPRDEFNSMISLGYSVLMNELYGKIEAKGLNPYFGFMHRDKEQHPTLASDLMEEWRAVIVDSTVMSMINGHEIQKDEFFDIADEPENDKVFVLIIYDIIENKKRIKLSKMLLGYGFRIQKSAFEAVISKKKYKELLERLPAYASSEDSIKVYKIIGKGQVVSFGKAEKSENEDIIII